MENYTGATIDSLIARIEWLNQYVINLDELIRIKFLYLEGCDSSKYYINRPIFKEVVKLKPSSMVIKDRKLIGIIRQVQSMEILVDNKMFHYKRIENYITKINKERNNG